MARLAPLVALAGSLACTSPVYECMGAENCVSRDVQGVCEDVGYCSYPDDACPSGQRFDEFAGDGLDRECVDPADGGCVSACVDADGDGYGVGDACAGPDCDDDNPAHADRCIYVAPGVADGDGSIDAPFASFASALPLVEPGTSLVLLDGVYEASTTGLLSIDCAEGGNAPNGTPELPIGVRAANERAAEIVGGGLTAAIKISNCGWWRLNGLRATGGDLRTSDGSDGIQTVALFDSHDLVVRRLLVAYSNRYSNSNLVEIRNVDDLLLEEIEAYWFHRAAFLVYESERVTFRRCYAHSRDHADLEGCTELGGDDPYCSTVAEGGDVGFTIYRATSDIAFENCIVDGRAGLGFNVGDAAMATALRGDIVMGDVDIGILAAPSAADAAIVGTRISDSLVLAPRAVGVLLRSTTDSRLDGVTVLDSQDSGVQANQSADVLCSAVPGGCSVTMSRVLAQRNAGSGILVSDQGSWLLQDCNSFGNGTDYPGDEDIADELDYIQRSSSIDANLGTAIDQCVVYVPQSSPVHGLAADGGDIGAAILFREEGTTTDVPLWDPQTGVFPCGALVAGINDAPGSSCIGVHARLNVFGNGCAAPPGYTAPDACGS